MISANRRDCLVAAIGSCLLLSAPAPVAAQPAPTIDRAEVERIVSTLASDEMRGREAFTEDALRAADFIAGEFAQAGLDSFDGADGHLQDFQVLAYSMGPARVNIDGQRLSPDRFQVRYGVPSIDWSTGDAEVVVVGPDDDPTGIAIGVANAGVDALVLIDPVHEEPFRTIAQMYRRPTQHVSGTERGTAVVALSAGSTESTYLDRSLCRRSRASARQRSGPDSRAPQRRVRALQRALRPPWHPAGARGGLDRQRRKRQRFRRHRGRLAREALRGPGHARAYAPVRRVHGRGGRRLRFALLLEPSRTRPDRRDVQHRDDRQASGERAEHSLDHRVGPVLVRLDPTGVGRGHRVRVSTPTPTRSSTSSTAPTTRPWRPSVSRPTRSRRPRSMSTATTIR